MISIQTRDITDELASLVKRIDSLVDDPADNAKMKKAFVVLITDDPEEAQRRLEQLAENRKLKNIPLTIFDGVRGPPGYQIASKAEVTVMMWKDNQVELNLAFAAGQLDDRAVNKVVADAKKFLVIKVVYRVEFSRCENAPKVIDPEICENPRGTNASHNRAGITRSRRKGAALCVPSLSVDDPIPNAASMAAVPTKDVP